MPTKFNIPKPREELRFEDLKEGELFTDPSQLRDFDAPGIYLKTAEVQHVVVVQPPLLGDKRGFTMVRAGTITIWPVRSKVFRVTIDEASIHRE